MPIHMVAAAVLSLAPPAPDIHFACDSLPPGAAAVRLVEDGAAGRALAFGGPGSVVDLGPCPVDSTGCFRLSVSIRTRQSDFCTPIMARNGEQVGLSLILGRQPGRVSFEAWSWQGVKVLSRSRIDDGAWHRVEVEYEPVSNLAALWIDGRLEAAARLGPGASHGALLRLGNNIGVDQPFHGELDELSIDGRLLHADRFNGVGSVLSAEQVAGDLAAWRERLTTRPIHLPSDAAGQVRRSLELRRTIADAMGLSPLPERGPTQVRIHGELTGGGVRIQRVSWNSWPGYRATGWLWTAESPTTGKKPVMLMPHGHWAGGAIDPVVQVRAARMARAGYLTLVPDAVHVEDIAAGVSTGGAMAWNNIRALDWLQERADVDPARVGTTGASGGAQQIMYLMALEDRITAAAPVCMISRFGEILSDTSAHCGCNHTPRVACIADEPELCAAFAPRPALFICVTGDWTHNFPTQGWPEILGLYRALDAATGVHMQQFVSGHDYNAQMRSRVYQFFDPLLGPPHPEADEKGFTAFSSRQLMALGPPTAPPDRAAMVSEHLARRARFESLKQTAPALPWKPSRGVWQDLGPAREGSAWKRLVLHQAGGPRLGVLGKGLDQPSDKPILIVVAPEDPALILLGGPAWLASADRVAIIEPRFCGAWSPFAEAWRRNGMLLGCGEGYVMAHDIASVIHCLPGSPTVRIVALGACGVPALIACQMGLNVDRLVLDDIGPRYASAGARLPACPEILRFGDLPELIDAARVAGVIHLGGFPAGPAPGRAACRLNPATLSVEQISAALED